MNPLASKLAALAEFIIDFPLGAVIVGEDRTIVAINSEFIRLTGLQSQEVQGLTVDEFDKALSSRSDSALPYRPCWQLPSDRRSDSNSECAPTGIGNSCQCEFLLTQPHWRRLRRRLQRSPCEGGLVIYFQDVTREAMLDQLKSDFLVNAAHELRTPVTSILGYAELLVTNDFDELEYTRLHRILFRQSRHLSSLLNDVLDIARLESSQFPSRRLELDLGQVAMLACGNYHAESDPRRPHVRIDADSIRILADQEQLVNCIHHLLENAYHYSYQQGEISIRVSVDGNDGWSSLEITDQGVGMTAEQAAKAFERFWRADQSGKHPGSGLGLSIVQQIMRRHGGVANIRSRPAQGTTVQLRFPPVNRAAVTLHTLKD
jgi:signal transduction histidine kinase